MYEFPFHADFKRSAKNVQESFKLWWCLCIDYLKLGNWPLMLPSDTLMLTVKHNCIT